MKQIIFLIALIHLAHLANGQRILLDTITWSASQDQNRKTGDRFSRPTSFVSYDTTQIVLNSANHPRKFAVSAVQGTWPDLTQPGQIVYQVAYADKTGTITIGRGDDQKIFLILDMSASGADGINTLYSIDHFTVQ